MFAVRTMTFHAYVLLNIRDEIYIGHTSDLPRRLIEHNDPLG